MKKFAFLLVLLAGCAICVSAQMYVWHDGSTTHEIAIPAMDSITFEDTDNPYSSLSDEQCLVFFPKRHQEVTIGADEQLTPVKVQVARRTSVGSLTVAVQSNNSGFSVSDSVRFADHETVAYVEISRTARTYYDAQVTLTVVDPRSHAEQTLSSQFTLTVYQNNSDKRITDLENSMKELYMGLGHLGYTQHNDFSIPATMLFFEVNGQDFTGFDIGYNWFDYSLYPQNRDTSLTTKSGRVNHLVYNTYYNIIDETNQIINSVKSQDADDWECLKCQAKTLRAFCYLQLVQVYQKTYRTNSQDLAVPLLLEDASVATRFTASRATVANIYAQIIRDLNDACACNDESFLYSNNKGISKAVAFGLRARANLIKPNYTAAISDAQKCLELSGATPLSIEECQQPGFADLNAQNVIWAIDINEDDDVVSTGIVNWPSHLCSFYMDGYTGVGALHGISSALYDRIPSSDVRKGWWLDQNLESPLLNQGEYVNAKSYLQSKSDHAYVTTKFGTGDGTTSGNGAAAADWILMRAEEMHLIIAEAKQSATYLQDFVRTYRDPDYTPSGNILDDVWLQRRIELWGEGFAFQDLLRLQKDLIRSTSTNWPATWIQDFYHTSPDWDILVWQIPSAEPIDTSHVDTDVVPTIEQPSFYFGTFSDSIIRYIAGKGQASFPIYRYAMAEAYDLPVKWETSDSSFYSVPSFIHFDKLQNSADLPISYSTPLPGKQYDLCLSISNAEVTTEKPIENHYFIRIIGKNEVYFQKQEYSLEVDLENFENPINLPLVRRNSTNALTVPITTIQGDDFQVPYDAYFAEGVDTVMIPVTFTGNVSGKDYPLIISVSDQCADPSSTLQSVCTLTVSTISWTKADFPSVWVDGSWTGAFSIDPVPVWYVDYEYMQFSDGGAKYRFSKPYASHPSNWDKTTKQGTPDRYGVYDGFPANYPNDYNVDTANNAICTIDATGKAFWTRFNTGVNWSYGYFYVGNISKDYTASEDDYPLGSYKSNVISFPKSSMYLYIPKYGAYPGGACTIYLDGKQYQQEHAVTHIADLEDRFNNTTVIQWTEIPAATANFYSQVIDQSWDQTISQAVDIDSINGEKSEFRNLFSLPNLYEENYCLAFYWDAQKGTVSIPEDQPTGLSFAGKEIFMGPSNEKSTVEIVVASGTPLFKFTFALALTTEDGNLIGEYEEVFYMGDEISWSMDAFLGNFNYAGVSAFDGTDVEAKVTISQVDDSTVVIEGLHQYSSGVYGVFDSISSTLSIVPQVQDSIGRYDITFFTIDLNDDTSTTAPIILKANIDGSVGIDSNTTEAIGWGLNSKEAGGMLTAVYGFDLTPSSESAPVAKQVSESLLPEVHPTLQPAKKQARSTKSIMSSSKSITASEKAITDFEKGFGQSTRVVHAQSQSPSGRAAIRESSLMFVK